MFSVVKFYCEIELLKIAALDRYVLFKFTYLNYNLLSLLETNDCVNLRKQIVLISQEGLV